MTRMDITGSFLGNGPPSTKVRGRKNYVGLDRPVTEEGPPDSGSRYPRKRLEVGAGKKGMGDGALFIFLCPFSIVRLKSSQ